MPLVSPQDFIKMVRLNLRTAVPTPLLGLDLGTRYVGLAISDAKATKAYVLNSYATRKQSILIDNAFHNMVMKAVQDNEIKGIVVGYPEDNPNLWDFFVRTIEYLQFEKGLTVPVTKHIEHCSSWASKSIFKEFGKVDKRSDPFQDKKMTDQLAAMLILQDFLDLVHKKSS